MRMGEHMTITKQALKSKPECKVKFTLTAEEAGNAETVFLVGEFNDWNEQATPMKKQKNGNFSITLNLPSGERCMFRYLADGRWLNDPQADGYEFCPFANTDNSVLSL